ncbi:MAG: hypothetical protein ABW321_11260 [Polyangiales bacterium]
MKLLVVVLGLSLVALGACANGSGPAAAPGSEQADAGGCDDRDGDGYGEGCEKGGDCDEQDRTKHSGCTSCAFPQQGCSCEEASKPVSCYLTPGTTDDGQIMCHEGTRYCRAGQWSACESVVSYPRPEQTEQQAVVDKTAPVQRCTDCSINCYVIRDNLNPLDAGLDATSNGIAAPPNGGLTLIYTLVDAGIKDSGNNTVFDPSKCVLGTAPDQDCDGIPDIYDPAPGEKPFATTNSTLFMDLGPGESGTGVINLQFYLNQADVYFLVDQTASMAGERDQLKKDLVTGDFIADPTVECADYDFDFKPNNELKSQGIVGAVRCMIRDANFGVGYFREYPFPPYGNTDNIPFRNLHDITASLTAVTAGVNALVTQGNISWPENDAPALWMLTTGNGAYTGINRPGVAPRTDCPSGTFGYPCFRNKAIPIVLMFTDAPLHNGPSNNDYPYAATDLAMTQGTTQGLTPVSKTAETYQTAMDIGDITNTFRSYWGNTVGMTSDFPRTSLTCAQSGTAGPDVAFKFTLSSTKTILATTAGSEYNTTLAILRGTPDFVNVLPSYPNTNDNAATAYSFGNLNAKFVQAAGNSTGLVSDYSANDTGCSSVPGAADTTFTFTLPSATKVALDTTGSGYNTSLALFSGSPVSTTYTASADTNDTIQTQQDLGVINNRSVGVTGNTGAATITNNYTSTQLACSPSTAAPNSSAPDAVYSFSLNKATRVRISSDESAFKPVLALTSNGAPYTVSTAITANDIESTAYDMGVINGNILKYTGSTASMTANYPTWHTSCNSTSSGPSRDSVVKFTVTSPTTVSLDTAASGFNTTLSLFRSTINQTAVVMPSVQANDTIASAYDLGTLNGTLKVTSGASTYVDAVNNLKSDYMDVAALGCSPHANSPDAVFKFRVAKNTTVRFDTTGSAFDTALSVFRTSTFSAANRAGCNNGSSVSGRSYLEASILAGFDYYVVIKGRGASTTRGAYTLAIADADADANRVDCNDDAGFLTVTSVLNNEAVTAGTYYAVIRGNGTASGSYTLNIKDDNAVATSSATCDQTTGAGSTALIEQDLAIGTYRVMVKGKASTDKGAYRLTVRDLTAVPTNRVSCNYTAGASKLEADLDPGTYTVVLKGIAAAGAGAYKLNVRDATRTVITDTVVACDNDNEGLYYDPVITTTKTSAVRTSLTAGTYYAVVKGYATSSVGNFQLNIGGATPTTGVFQPPTWATTMAALKAKHVRVMPILSCHDDLAHGDLQGDCVAARKQAVALANVTEALGPNAKPLVFDIDGDGGGLSSTVVQGIGALANYLEMNVSARVAFTPDANPGFLVSIRPVDRPGDGCSGIVGSEHVRCAPGAAPRFEVVFSNPTTRPVRTNKNDPNGGYNFKIELIGDQQYVVDQVPVYIIPKDVDMKPMQLSKVTPSGRYWQDITASSCVGTQRPDWHDLTWTTDAPKGTTVKFSLCASDDQAALAKCTPIPVCTITGGADCEKDSDCPNGFCSADLNCQTITANSCTADKDCLTGATCRSGTCTYSRQPVYAGKALGTSNYTSNVRVFIDLAANVSDNTAPTVYDWSLNYMCNSVL